ncbi:MAG: toll/interleukin-1 receptor domain-containing protein [Pseudonocardiaceae bacterium]
MRAGRGFSGAVFLSYRRQETRHIAGRIADRLSHGPHAVRVFLDVDTIAPGDDFAAAITNAVAACDSLVAVIGPAWATVTDHRGLRRLDDPYDYVVLEITAALEQQKRVIPVLVDGAAMPRPEELPPVLRPLAQRNAVHVDHETFGIDSGALVAALGVSATNRPTRVNPRGVAMIGAVALVAIVASVLLIVRGISRTAISATAPGAHSPVTTPASAPPKPGSANLSLQQVFPNIGAPARACVAYAARSGEFVGPGGVRPQEVQRCAVPGEANVSVYFARWAAGTDLYPWIEELRGKYQAADALHTTWQTEVPGQGSVEQGRFFAGQFSATVQIYAAYYDDPFSITVIAPSLEAAIRAFGQTASKPLHAG